MSIIRTCMVCEDQAPGCIKGNWYSGTKDCRQVYACSKCKDIAVGFGATNLAPFFTLPEEYYGGKPKTKRSRVREVGSKKATKVVSGG